MKSKGVLPLRPESYYRAAQWVYDMINETNSDFTRNKVVQIRNKFLTYIDESPSTDFTSAQLAAIDQVVAWHKHYWDKDVEKKDKRQVFRLFGYAGTGKTTLAKEIAFRINEFVLFTAFTGKACMVLTSKGCKAHTIHSTHYVPDIDDTTGKVLGFRPAEIPASALASLVIVDECSMVDDEMGTELLAAETPILVLGDPFQLPPITGPGFFDREEPDVLLTEVHRNAKNSPVLRLATDVRLGKPLEYGDYGESKVVPKKHAHRHLMKCDQILCGKNSTREMVNKWVRKKLGFTGYVVSGERLVCLRNVPNSPTMVNGASWKLGNDRSFKPTIIKSTVTKRDNKGKTYSVMAEDWVLEARARCTDFDKKEAPFQEINIALDPLIKGFDYPWYLSKPREQTKNGDAVLYPVLHMDYGYCLTVHKAQGSQWDAVAVMNEASVFREHSQRWLYTAITRAVNKVIIFT